MADYIHYTLLGVFLLICVIMVVLILLQRGRGGGLAGAFGGGGANTAFGAKTGDYLTWATSVVFGLFLLLAIGLNLTANSIHARETGAPVPTLQTGPTPPIGSSLPAAPTTADPGVVDETGPSAVPAPEPVPLPVPPAASTGTSPDVPAAPLDAPAVE